jgi:hypothetical protein
MSLPGFTAERALGRAATYVSEGLVALAGGAVAPAAIEPFCHRGSLNCMSDCLRRCQDPGGFCEHNCHCCCTGHTVGCFM